MLTARYPTKSARTEDQNCLAPPSETIRQPSAYIRMKNVHLSLITACGIQAAGPCWTRSRGQNTPICMQVRLPIILRGCIFPRIELRCPQYVQYYIIKAQQPCKCHISPLSIFLSVPQNDGEAFPSVVVCLPLESRVWVAPSKTSDFPVQELFGIYSTDSIVAIWFILLPDIRPRGWVDSMVHRSRRGIS